MKKILNYSLLILILFLPLFVDAKEEDINIKSIELVEKSTETEELKPPSYEGLIIDFNLKFKKLNDNAKYKVIIKNNSDKDYKINENNTSFSKEEFITYDFIFEENSNIIKPNTEKTMYITITYHKKVIDDLFVNGIYKNDNYMNLSLSTEKTTDTIKNPETGIEHILYVISFIIIAISITTYIVIKKKNAPISVGLILCLIIIPITVKALEEIKIEINAYVEIEKPQILNFTMCGEEYQYEEGMTFNDWLTSKYNLNNIIFVEETDDLIWNYTFFVTIENNNVTETVYKTDIINSTTNYLCETVAECVSPESEILTSIDGTTIQAKNIKENDQIVYYDETTKINKIGKVKKIYIHKDATNFIKYTFTDNTYLEATDYHPIYTKEGWKSYTNRNGYKKPQLNDVVKAQNKWKKIVEIKTYTGKEDFYDFQVITADGKFAKNYYANNTLVEGSY